MTSGPTGAVRRRLGAGALALALAWAPAWAAAAPERSPAPAPRPAAPAAPAAGAVDAVDVVGAGSTRPEPRPAVRAAVRAAALSSSSPQSVSIVEGAALAEAMRAVRAGDWRTARAAAGGPVARDVVLWHELRARRGTWEEASDFAARRADWPGMPLLRARAEGLIPAEAAPGAVLAWFGGEAPATGAGALRLAAALGATGRGAAAQDALIRAWRTLPMTEAQEDAVLRAAGRGVLAAHDEARLDALLWEKSDAGVRRAMARVGPGLRALAEARLALHSGRAGVNALIDAVPAALAGDPGLAFDRVRWRLDRDLDDAAVELMLMRSGTAAELGRPEAWADMRRGQARRLMRAGRAQEAYALAASGHLTEGTDHSDLEWLAGFVALTDLGRPADALRHFKRAERAVRSPISMGRMLYWQGRALEASGDAAAAGTAFERAAVHRTAFYGQLAAERIGAPPDASLAGAEAATPLRALARDDVLRAAELLLAAGERRLAARFAAHLGESQDEAGLRALGQWAAGLGSPFLQVAIGKRAAQMGIVLPAHLFPLHPLARAPMPVEPAVAMAVARRESEFHPGAASGAGAQGLMQLMPGTARDVSRGLGIGYSRGRLTSDPDYNVRLGTTYLAGLEERFGDNLALIAAGYNAGPGRPIRWMRERGDPRAMGVDEAVDWIEHIPFTETRDYVMRVTESVPVYRARLPGAAAATDLSGLIAGR